jgi:hypothetical protein
MSRLTISVLFDNEHPPDKLVLVPLLCVNRCRQVSTSCGQKVSSLSGQVLGHPLHVASSLEVCASLPLLKVPILIIRWQPAPAMLRGDLGHALTCAPDVLAWPGARLGLYTPIKSAIVGEGNTASLNLKILSGSLSGGLAAAVTSPIELVKTRLQVRDASLGCSLSTAQGLCAVTMQHLMLGTQMPD